MSEPSDCLAPEKPIINHHKFINLWQTNEERQEKYWLCCSFGIPSNLARRMRDWRLSTIERYLEIQETYNNHTKAYDRDLSQYAKIAIPV